MNLKKLDNLVKTGQLKKESFEKSEFIGLIKSGKVRLLDAQNKNLSSESRFDLAYNAAHSLALSALRWHGYRSNHRYIVFQVLTDTLNIDSNIWRILSKCHDLRNLAEYEDFLEVDKQLLNDLISCTQLLLERVEKLKI